MRAEDSVPVVGESDVARCRPCGVSSGHPIGPTPTSTNRPGVALEGPPGPQAYRSPAKRNAHPGIQFGIAGTENSPRSPILSRIGTCPRPSAPCTPWSAGSCLRSRHAERTESTVRQIPLGSAVIVIGRPSQLPVRWPSICRAVIGVGPRSAWGDISRAQVAGADLHGAVKDPLGVRG